MKSPPLPLPLYKREGGEELSFWNFRNFFHKKGGVGRKGEASLIFILTNLFQCYLSLLWPHNSYCKYGCVSLLAPECVVCLCVCICVLVCVWYQIRVPAKKPHHESGLSKLNSLLHKTCIEVLRLYMCTFMISLTKIAHQMWRDHPFSQRNKTTEWADGVVTGGDREGGMWAGGGSLDKTWKRRGRQYRGSSWDSGVRTPLPTMNRKQLTPLSQRAPS